MLCQRLVVRGLQISKKIKVFPQIRATTVLSISTTRRYLAKLFLDAENNYAHEVLESSFKKYQIFRVERDTTQDSHAQLPTMVLDPTSAATITIDEIFSAFCALSQHCARADSGTCISNPCFLPFTELFCRQAHNLSDEQLLESLRHLAQMPPADSSKEPNYAEIWNTLDVVCTKRADKWNTDQLLMWCDAWYSLNLARICEFVWEALRRLSRKVRTMNTEQLVHTMFFCNVVRKPIFAMFDFEVSMVRCIDGMSLQEIGVMAMGFFKTQTPIRSPELIENIFQRLMVELDKVQDITLVSLLKVLRYSSKLSHSDSMLQLLEGLCPQIERLSLLSCLHVALLGSDVQVCHEQCMELVLQRFNRDLQHARLKDMERMCFVLSVFNYESPHGTERLLSTNILKQLQSKVDEILKYPRCFPTCLHFLSIKGFYNSEMISSVLDTRFLKHAYGKSEVMGREVFHLDSFVKINLKDASYTGNQLTERNRRVMGKMLTNYLPERNSKFKLNHTDRVLLEVKEATERIVRGAKFKHILPHYQRPDVVICYDRKAHKDVEFSPQCPEDYSGVILTRKELLGDKLFKEIDTIAIVVVGANNVVRGTDRHTGLCDMKLEQLKLLGHKSVVIYWHAWHELETPKDREMFLKRKLATVTHL